MRLVRLEELARVRLEKDDAGGRSQRCGPILGDLQQRLVPAVHAVEVADRECTAPRGRRHIVGSVKDDHLRGQVPGVRLWGDLTSDP